MNECERESRVGLERAGVGVSVGCRLRPQSEASVESTVSEAILGPALPPVPRLSENYSVETKLLSSSCLFTNNDHRPIVAE